MQWYYAINGQRSGPVEQDVIESMLRDGTLKPDDLVWNQEMGGQWAKASAAPGLGAQGGGRLSPRKHGPARLLLRAEPKIAT